MSCRPAPLAPIPTTCRPSIPPRLEPNSARDRCSSQNTRCSSAPTPPWPGRWAARPWLSIWSAQLRREPPAIRLQRCRLQRWGSDRLVDTLVAWGSRTPWPPGSAVHLDAGATEVAVQVLTVERSPRLLGAEWRQAAEADQLIALREKSRRLRPDGIGWRGPVEGAQNGSGVIHGPGWDGARTHHREPMSAASPGWRRPGLRRFRIRTRSGSRVPTQRLSGQGVAAGDHPQAAIVRPGSIQGYPQTYRVRNAEPCPPGLAVLMPQHRKAAARLLDNVGTSERNWFGLEEAAGDGRQAGIGRHPGQEPVTP